MVRLRLLFPSDYDRCSVLLGGEVDYFRAVENLMQAVGAGVHRSETVLLVAVLVAAIGYRIFLASSTNFPINDGALFLEFVQGVGRTFPLLPTTIEYNGLTIPFAYPPLAFWMGAALTRLGADSLQVVHLMPLGMNIVYVLSITLLLLQSGRTRLFTALALLFFCTRLRSFEWLVMGGGMSRGLGAVFFIGALIAVGIPTYRTQQPRGRSILAGACVAGAILSHLEWGVLAASSVVLSRALGAPTARDFIVSSTVSGLTAIVLISPWLLAVYECHGLTPFLYAGGTSEWGLGSSAFALGTFARSALSNPLVVLGAMVSLGRRNAFWYVFVLLCAFLTPRHAATPLMIPVAIFAAEGALFVYRSLASRIASRRVALGAVASAVALLVLGNIHRDTRSSAGSFRPLTAQVRQGMKWVAQNHPRERFAVITDKTWYYDSSAEWFPTLTGATSVTTVQGREWLPNGAFDASKTEMADLKSSSSCTNLLTRLRSMERADYVWVEFKPECFTAGEFQKLYQNGRVAVFRSL